jgi:hypothetical protein
MNTNQRFTLTLHATILKLCHYSPESSASPLDPGLEPQDHLIAKLPRVVAADGVNIWGRHGDQRHMGVPDRI